MTRKAPRADSYEAQLSDGQQIELHDRLLSGRETLATIRKTSPPWATGHLKGKQPCIATLGNIRDRLTLRATLQENEATTETLLEDIKREVPTLSNEQLAEYGHRIFSLLALRKGDGKLWVSLRLSAKAAGELKLAREKFEVAVAVKLLDEAMLRRAQEIATSDAPQPQRIAEMRRLYFADVDALQASGAVQIPPP